MCKLLMYKLHFPNGYRIGKRLHTNIINSSYLFRAITAVAFELGKEDIVEEALLKRDIALSSLLPSITYEGLSVPALIYPRLPIRGLRKPKAILVDMYGASELLGRISKGLDLNVRIIEAPENRDEPCLLTLSDSESTSELEKCRKRVIILTGSQANRRKIDSYTRIETGYIYRNRVDRITKTAEPFIFYYYKVVGPLHLMACVKEEYIEDFNNILKVLGEKGLGASRSLGYGKFRIEHCQDSLLDLDKVHISRLEEARRKLLLLGDCPITKKLKDSIDFSKSIPITYRVYGYLGHRLNYGFLHLQSLLAPGSVLKLKDNRDLEFCKPDLPFDFNFPQLFIYNPLVLGD